MTDRLSTPITASEAIVAAQSAFQFLRGEWTSPTEHESSQIIDLMMEIAPYSHTFRLAASGLRLRGRPEFKSVTITATDGACVNNGCLLATCWLDEHGRFYFEA